MAIVTCLGIESLGLCNYDPAAPSANYFTLGNVVAALAFTIALQNFIKPVFDFRLRVRRITTTRLFGLVFCGAFCIVIATLVPHTALLHPTILGYAIFWEILASLMFFGAYGAVAFAAVRPVNVSPTRVAQFAQSAAKLLSEANESDHLELLKDLRLSLPTLIRLARFVERDTHEPTTAFYDFIHRHKIEQASYAHSFLRIIADGQFCRTLVDRAPWEVSRLLTTIVDGKLYARAAEAFISELAQQALSSDDAMMDREMKYHGFGTAPLLSDSLFAEPFVVERYNPLDFYFDSETVTPRIIKRFNSSSLRIFETLISSRRTDHSYAAYGAKRFYETAFMGLYAIQDASNYDFNHVMEIRSAVLNAIKLADRLMASMSERSYEYLFVEGDEEHHRHDVLEVLVEIVFDGLCGIANKFRGVEDHFWMVGREAISEAFNSIGAEPDGMTPFQQRLAIRLIDKLRDNMTGYYPAISRVLLATVGPLREVARQENETAFNILQKAVYQELLKLPELAARKPEKLGDFFPDNVAYDVDARTLTHTYSGGAIAITDLKTIAVEPVSLIDPRYRRKLSAEQIENANEEIF
jgi:hypothetical protein